MPRIMCGSTSERMYIPPKNARIGSIDSLLRRLFKLTMIKKERVVGYINTNVTTFGIANQLPS